MEGIAVLLLIVAGLVLVVGAIAIAVLIVRWVFRIDDQIEHLAAIHKHTKECGEQLHEQVRHTAECGTVLQAVRDDVSEMKLLLAAIDGTIREQQEPA